MATNQFTGQMRLLFAHAFVGADSGSGSPVQAVQQARLWAALHWHWNIAGLVIAAAVALITVLTPRESGRRSGPAS